jgi:hypothetical protein
MVHYVGKNILTCLNHNVIKKSISENNLCSTYSAHIQNYTLHLKVEVSEQSYLGMINLAS